MIFVKFLGANSQSNVSANGLELRSLGGFLPIRNSLARQ